MDSIDLSKINKNSKNQYNWENSYGIEINFYFKGVSGKLVLLGINKEFNYKIDVKYNGNIYTISKQQVVNCKLNPILKIKNKIPFKYNIGDIFIDKKRNIEILEQKRDIYIAKTGNKHNFRNYRCKCYVCGSSDIWISESHLNENRGCPVCHSKQFDEKIISIPITAPWMIPYFQGGYDEAKLYTKSSSKKLFFKCPDCGEIKNKEMTINKLNARHSIGCVCGDGISYPNKFMFDLLTQLQIDFKTEYSPIWIKPKRYDFYFEIDNKKYIIEMDGGLGHGKRIHPKAKLTKEDTLNIDMYKENLALDRNIKLFRINCEYSEMDYISNNIINSQLSKILNLNDADWLKCHKFALKNIIKTICDFKVKNPWMDATQISKIFNLSNETVSRYLNKGNKIGWCKYNGNTKCVEVFKNGISIGIFKSSKYLHDNATEILGVNISYESIRCVCRKEKEFCKGYHFEYVYT